MNAFQSILDNKIIAIARKIYGEDLINLAKALKSGGIVNIELTFDQADEDCIFKTYNGIMELNNIDGLCIGAGTVLSIEQLYAAHRAGANYIVSPNTDANIIKATKNFGMASMPGAITATEIIAASNEGADFVKIFPAGPIGMDYIKALCTPLNHIKFVANAGVDLHNINDFFDAGFCVVGISNYLCNTKLIRDRNWSEITHRAKIITSAIAKLI